MLKNEQIKVCVKKLNQSVNWCMDGKINSLWEEVSGGSVSPSWGGRC